MTNNILKEVTLTQANGGCEAVTERIIVETALTLRVNGAHHATAMVLAGMEREFAAGFLYATGVIATAADIADIHMDGTTVDVTLTGTPGPTHQPEAVRSDLIINRDDVFACVRAILTSDVFAETEAVHSAGLFLDGKEKIAIAEDIGRQAAPYKVIGAGLLQNVDFSRTLVASTGRVPAEMLATCHNAGIPVIATKGVPTTLAVGMAEASGITMCGLVRGSTMYVYSHPERIL